MLTFQTTQKVSIFDKQQQRNITRQLIYLWLKAISSLFDRLTADKQTHV